MQGCKSPSCSQKGPGLTHWRMRLISVPALGRHWKAPGTYREEVNCPTSVQAIEGEHSLPFEPLSSPSPTQPAIVGGLQIWVAIELASPWWSPQSSPHPAHTQAWTSQQMHLLISSWAWPTLWTSWKSLKGPQTPNKHALIFLLSGPQPSTRGSWL